MFKEKCKQYVDDKKINIQTLFRKFDKNNDKFITIEEFEKQTVNLLELEYEPKLSEAIFERLDMDSDFKINY